MAISSQLCSCHQTTIFSFSHGIGVYEEEGDGEAFGLAKLVKSYNFIAIVSMLCDALDPVARLCTALQAKTLDFAELNFLVDTCTADLEAMMSYPNDTTEHFKKIDTLLSTELKEWDLHVSDEMKSKFKQEILTPYFKNLIDNIKGRFEDSRGIITALSIFDPRHLPEKDSELQDYGLQQMNVKPRLLWQSTFNGAKWCYCCCCA